MHVNPYMQNAVTRRIRHIMCFACRSCFSWQRFSASDILKALRAPAIAQVTLRLTRQLSLIHPKNSSIFDR